MTRTRRQLLDATALRTHRYGLGSERHNISLWPGTWDRLSKYTSEGGEDNNSAFIQIGISLLEAALHPMEYNLIQAVKHLTVGAGNETPALMGLASNLRELADRLEQASQEPARPVGANGDKP